MIAMLLHHTLGGDRCNNRFEGNKREYTTIVKKIKVRNKDDDELDICCERKVQFVSSE